MDETVVTNESTPETVETPITEQAVNTEYAEPSAEKVETTPEKTFTQAELNEIITKRIERERETTSKKAAQEARDAYIAEQGYEWNGSPITTEAAYKQALKEQKIMEELQEKGLPDEVIQELVESRKDREERAKEKQQMTEKQQQEAEYKAFLETYPDVDPKDIPQSVWDDVGKGKSLVDAFVRHENQSLKQRLEALEQAKQIEQQNQANAASSTGSVTGNGTSAPAFFTQEQVSKMSTSEVNKNWTAINESMKKW